MRMLSFVTPGQVVPPLSPANFGVHGGAVTSSPNWRPLTQWLVSPAFSAAAPTWPDEELPAPGPPMAFEAGPPPGVAVPCPAVAVGEAPAPGVTPGAAPS